MAVGVASALKQRFGTDWFEFFGFVTGVMGVYFVTVEHIITWPIGLINVSLYAYVFFVSRLYADMTLQFFFFVLCVHGWYQWTRGGENKSNLRISRIETADWIKIVAFWALGFSIYYPLVKYFNGAAPFLDSTLTAGSIIAQLLLNRKKLENWIIWIILDILYIPLFLSRNLVATAVLYAILLCLAISGFISWRRSYMGANTA